MAKAYFYRIIRCILKPIFYLLYRPTVIGRAHVPRNSAVILAGNHAGGLDAVLLAVTSKDVIHFLAKKELTDGTFGFLFKSMGIIPVDRKHKNPQAMERAKDYLKQGAKIGIFPEGTINRTEDVILPFKFGAVKLAYDTNTPIVPFTITGGYKLLKKRVKLTFSEPIEIGENLAEENHRLEQIIIERLEKEASQ